MSKFLSIDSTLISIDEIILIDYYTDPYAIGVFAFIKLKSNTLKFKFESIEGYRDFLKSLRHLIMSESGLLTIDKAEKK